MTERAETIAKPVVLAHEPDFSVGSLFVQPSTRQVAGKSGSETLEPRVMQVLVALHRASGAIVTQEDLIESCWGGVVVGDNAIHRVISRIRHIAAELGGDSFRVETIAKVGYRLDNADSHPPAANLPVASLPRALPTVVRTRSGQWLRIASIAVIPAVILVTALLLAIRPEEASGQQTSLAVLPFRTLSNSQDYFAEGIAEEILGNLAREPELRVAGRISSRALAAGADAREVGRKLDVSYVLEGAVRKDGNQVRVTVALVRTADGMQHWSGAYAGTLDDIFLIQQRIGSEVVDSLRHRLVHSAPTTGPLTTKGDVYSAYLSARKLARMRESAKATEAIALLRDAVKRDPGYAPAWAELGKAIAILMSLDPVRERATHQAEAVGHVRRALALAPDLAEAHTAMAIVLGIDLPEAEHHIRRAAQLDPNNPEVQLYLAHAHAVAGDFPKQLATINRAVELDPMFRAASGAMTWVMPTFGQDDVALRQLARLERNGSPDLWHLRGHFDWARHDHSQAVADLLKDQKIVTFPNRNRGDQHLGELLRQLGYSESASKVTRFDEGIGRLWQGKVPTIEELRARNRTCLPYLACAGEGNDHDGYFGVLATKLLLNAGRGGELARLYDREGLVGLSPRHLTDRPGILVSNGPMLVLALRAAGRAAEADRLLATIDGHSRAILARGPVPNWFHFDRAQALALMGRRSEALAALEQALARGWIYGAEMGGEMTLPDIGNEPALRTMRGEPRFERIRAQTAAYFTRERAEVAKLAI